MTMYDGSYVVNLFNNNSNFIFGHACKLLNTDTVRPGGAEKTLRSSRPPPSKWYNFQTESYSQKTIFLLPWHYTTLFLS